MASWPSDQAPPRGGIVIVEKQEIPLPSKQHVAVDFIENRASDFRDIQGNLPCRYDVNQEKFVPKPTREADSSISLDVLEEELNKSKMQLTTTNESFSRAIRKLKAESKDNAVATFNLSDCHDWEEVGQAMERLTAEHSSDKNAWAKVRKMFRAVGDNSQSIQSFVGLLPDGQYKSLAGGLTIILTVSMSGTLARCDLICGKGNDQILRAP
jgi:hypothetical protein